ncbi:MAG: VOC family protein [Phycisphaerales bacterium]|nr:VOC family protein [Phycisphaerales bacterium]
MAEPSPAPPIAGVSEIALNVRDLAGMTAFYERVLGFTPFRPEAREGGPTLAPPPESVSATEPTIVFLTIGGDAASRNTPSDAPHPPLLVLIDPARHAPAAGRFDGPVARTSTLNHIAFQIPPAAYDSEAARLRALGLEVTPVIFAWMGAKALFFRDPEGNTIELICRDVKRA